MSWAHKDGEEIKLSTLCNDEEPSVYSNKIDMAAIDAELNRHELEEGDLQDLTIEGEDAEEDSFADSDYEEEIVNELEDFGDESFDDENN